MALPRPLLEAIVRQVPGNHDRRRVALQWTILLPRLEATADRIRRQVSGSLCGCELSTEVSDGRCSRCYGALT